MTLSTESWFCVYDLIGSLLSDARSLNFVNLVKSLKPETQFKHSSEHEKASDRIILFVISLWYNWLLIKFEFFFKTEEAYTRNPTCVVHVISAVLVVHPCEETRNFSPVSYWLLYEHVDIAWWYLWINNFQPRLHIQIVNRKFMKLIGEFFATWNFRKRQPFFGVKVLRMTPVWAHVLIFVLSAEIYLRSHFINRTVNEFIFEL